MAGPAGRKDNGTGVEGGDVTKAQKRRLQRRPRVATWAPGPGISDPREGEEASGARGRSRRVRQPGGARGPGGGAGRVSHLYCLKSWSDSLKPLLSSMLMPARASSASCRGAAAAAATVESPSSCRRGRCCSEPAMGARGCAQGRGEVGRQLLRPRRARSPALPARSGAQPSGAGEGRRAAGRAGAGRGEEPGRLQRGGGRERPGRHLPPPRELLSSRPPACSSRSLRDAPLARAPKWNPFPGVSHPAEPGPERPPPLLPAASARRPGPSRPGSPPRTPRPAALGQRAEPARTLARH